MACDCISVDFLSSQIGYTAKGVYTHELYVGPNNLADFARNQDQFSLLGSNIIVDSGHQLAQLIQPHILKDASGVLVGITSVSDETMCAATSCSVNGRVIVSVGSARQALAASVGYLLNRGADVIVAICAG